MQLLCRSIEVIAVGAADANYQRILDDYEQRISRYVSFKVHIVKGAPLRDGDEAVREAEGARIGRILDRIETATTASTTVIACDLGGSFLTSEKIAERVAGSPHVVVLIGGACGLTEELKRKAHLRLAFGAATLPHQLARVVCTEQLYRSFRIAKNEPYHH